MFDQVGVEYFSDFIFAEINGLFRGFLRFRERNRTYLPRCLVILSYPGNLCQQCVGMCIFINARAVCKTRGD